MIKIVVLNGSPKGDKSVTLHYWHYMARFMNDVDVEVINMAKYIKKFEKNPEYLSSAAESINRSDGVVWAFPVYTLLTPYQVVRFIEIMIDAGLAGVFKDKYCTSISTSMHFFDHTAHNYLHAVSEDLGMHYLPGHSADTSDLLKTEEQRNIKNFGLHFIRMIQKKGIVIPKYLPVKEDKWTFFPGTIQEAKHKKGDKKVVVLTDSQGKDSNLGKMVDTLIKQLPYEVDIINLNDLAMKGGCLGCIKCMFHTNCVYKDGFSTLHQKRIAHADLIINACTVKNRYLPSIWKMYSDRLFYNGHRVKRNGKFVAYLVSGPLRQLPELRGLFESMYEVSGEYLIDIVSDESSDSELLTKTLSEFAENITWAIEQDMRKTSNFLGIGGMKVFRDLVYSMKGLMKDDHLFYKKNNLYDYPQRNIGNRFTMFIMGLLMNVKFIREEAAKTAASSRLDLYKKVVSQAE